MILQINPNQFFEFNFSELATMELGIRFLINALALAIIILKIYQPTRRDQEYIFTYLIFGPVVFFMVNLFAQTQLGVGFAFGLFAVFSILRYRTTTIPVKEMTYMFTVISISVINAISTDSMVWSNLVIINLIIIGIVYLTEKSFYKRGVETQIILYEKIENIHPNRADELIKDLEERTGNVIEKFDVLESDYLRDSVKLRIYYRVNN